MVAWEIQGRKRRKECETRWQGPHMLLSGGGDGGGEKKGEERERCMGECEYRRRSRRLGVGGGGGRGAGDDGDGGGTFTSPTTVYLSTHNAVFDRVGCATQRVVRAVRTVCDRRLESEYPWRTACTAAMFGLN